MFAEEKRHSIFNESRRSKDYLRHKGSMYPEGSETLTGLCLQHEIEFFSRHAVGGLMNSSS